MPALLDLRMPGVYTQEVPTLPPAVGVIPSAVPVFIGYTEKAEKNGDSLVGKPIRIKSMQEYENWFGGPPKTAITVDVDNRPENPRRPEVKVMPPTDFYFKMYHALQLYYANGGGPCFILAVKKISDLGDSIPKKDDFDKKVFKELKKAKDVTILVFPDGTSMEENDYKSVVELALPHCGEMKNRVTIIDVHKGDIVSDTVINDAEAFQNNMPVDLEIKKYGMAYYPFLHTNLAYAFTKDKVNIRYHFENNSQVKAVQEFGDSDSPSDAEKTALNTAFTGDATKAPDANASEFKEETDNLNKAIEVYANNPSEENKTKLKTAEGAYIAKVKEKIKGNLSGVTLQALEILNNSLYNKIIEAIRNFGVVMPPSPAIAGIYVRTDATQGVWKAPANVSVFGTIKPAIELDDDDHASLNAPDNGKAINVIRAYPGRGILVYGGRTLAGNDLEWRYVNVRRTFCFIEDSIARAMQDFVFEPNNSQTWIKVKSMIGSFLNTLWKAGALYGDTPDAAYQVIVGEPESMSVQDVLGGIMRVIIKVAVARPAEFIVLQYEHKFELTEA